MTRTIHPAAIHLLAAVFAIFGTGRTTAHGATRYRLGSMRAHIDADGMVLWRAGGAAILATLEPGHPPRPVTAPLPHQERQPARAWCPAGQRVHRPRQSFALLAVG